MNTQAQDCGGCRWLGRYAPWGFLIVAALIARLPLDAGWQQGSAWLAVLALIMLGGSYLINRIAPGRRKF